MLHGLRSSVILSACRSCSRFMIQMVKVTLAQFEPVASSLLKAI